MEVGRHRGIVANEHITVGSSSHEKVKINRPQGLYRGKRNVWAWAGSWTWVSQQVESQARDLEVLVKVQIFLLESDTVILKRHKFYKFVFT